MLLAYPVVDRILYVCHFHPQSLLSYPVPESTEDCTGWLLLNHSGTMGGAVEPPLRLRPHTGTVII